MSGQMKLKENRDKAGLVGGEEQAVGVGREELAGELVDRVGRGRGGLAEGLVDLRLLEWADRFRFVTADRAARHLGVSERAARGRCSLLVRAGLLRSISRGAGTRAVLYPSHTTTRLLGSAQRTPPRPGPEIRHELAVIDTVHVLDGSEHELAVLTERECRRRQAAGDGQFGVPLPQSTSGRARERWPDLVLTREGARPLAVEIELTDKHTPRLTSIMEGYLYGDYQVLWLAGQPSLIRRLDRKADELAAESYSRDRDHIHIVQWTRDPARLRATVLAVPPWGVV